MNDEIFWVELLLLKVLVFWDFGMVGELVDNQPFFQVI